MLSFNVSFKKMGVYVCVCDGASEGENGGVKDALRYFNYLP